MRRHRHVITRSGVPAVHTSTTRKSAVPARQPEVIVCLGQFLLDPPGWSSIPAYLCITVIAANVLICRESGQSTGLRKNTRLNPSCSARRVSAYPWRG